MRRLVALDARSGALRWSVTVADNALGYAMTLAPLAFGDLVVVGVSGAEAGIRGFVDAYDARTGERRWRFHTIPAPGEPGSETWGGDSWKTGGGSAWVTGSFDPALGLLYWGVGNPGPLWNGDSRPGDNLYTCALVALEASTGRLRWHFQFTPHDTHDWDAAQIPVLFEGRVRGRPRKLVAMANRNGFYYVLDRTTGEFLSGTAYIRQDWAEGLDADRPAHRPAQQRAHRGMAPTSLRTCTAPATGTARPTVPAPGCSTWQPGRWAAATTSIPSATRPAATSSAGASRNSAATRPRGRSRRSTRSRAASAGAFRSSRRHGRGSCRPAGGWSSAGPTRGCSTHSMPATATRSGTSRPGAWSTPIRSPTPSASRQYVAIAAGSTLQVFSLPEAPPSRPESLIQDRQGGRRSGKRRSGYLSAVAFPCCCWRRPPRHLRHPLPTVRSRRASFQA